MKRNTEVGWSVEITEQVTQPVWVGFWPFRSRNTWRFKGQVFGPTGYTRFVWGSSEESVTKQAEEMKQEYLARKQALREKKVVKL